MDVFEQLKLRLPEYLASQGINMDGNGFAHCPLHDDKKTKSFHIIPGSGNKFWKCFGCKEHGNIFKMAHELEGFPEEGPDFFKVTVPVLAERFNIPNIRKTVSPEEAERGKMQAVFTYITSELVIDDTVKAFLKDRKLTIQTAHRFKVGRIPDYDVLSRKLFRQFDKTTLKMMGVLHRKLFENRILFPLLNEFGMTIGFTGRRLSDEDETVPKYINSLANPLFNKSKYLYNYHFAKKHKEIYLVEGQMDVLRLVDNHIMNVVAASGTGVTGDHIKILSTFQKVYLVFDGDAAGLKTLDKYIRLIPNGVPIVVPKGHDPDSYVRNYGIDSFLKLEHIDKIAWDIIKGTYHQPKDDAYRHLLIISRANPVFHKEYLKKLAKASGLEHFQLKAGLERILNDRSWKQLQYLINNKDKISDLNININMGEPNE